MAANILDKVRKKLLNKPEAEKDAIKWFRKQILDLGIGKSQGDPSHAARASGRAFRNELLNDPKLQKDGFDHGVMYLFEYDPKLKKTLPYFDKLPLIFPIEMYEDGFLALNVHYLPYRERLMLFKQLMEYQNNTKLTVRTKLQLSYQLLKGASSMALFKPCLKRYLLNHVRSKAIRIPAQDWETAIFLPVENFEKKSKTAVWKDSLELLEE